MFILVSRLVILFIRRLRSMTFPVEKFTLSLKEAGYADVEWREIKTGIEDYFMMLTNDISDGTGY